MAQLAIKGHPTRGKEVIEILEMLGGKNIHRIDAIRDYCVYFVMDDKNKTISSLKLNQVLPEQFIIYSLEEFEEKFPYKVGDEVTFDKYPCIITGMNWEYDDIVWEIESMQWINNEIKYIIQDNNKSRLCDIKAEDLQPYKEENYCQVIGNDTSSNGVDTSASSINEETMEEPEPKAPILSNRYDYAEGKCGYVIPDGYEFDCIKEGFQTEIILKPKKPQYPKTYEECCEVLGILEDRGFGFINLSECENTLMSHFIQLKRCRDAYWKIAGEQMGLGKPWEPDWDNSSTPREFIKINKGRLIHLSRVLVFPTAEIRDAFSENFKELIEQCKELL